jgi:hypothetical protein
MKQWSPSEGDWLRWRRGGQTRDGGSWGGRERKRGRAAPVVAGERLRSVLSIGERDVYPNGCDSALSTMCGGQFGPKISFKVIKAAPVSNEQSLTASNPILGKSGCSGEVTPQQSHNRKSSLLSALCSIEQVQVGLEIFVFPVKEQSTGGFF